MSASSTPEPLFEWTLWWPVERVPLQVEIVEPRKLTALEWALLRVMDAFRDEAPPLSEVAIELGLDDPSFLRETLREVIRLRALAPREAATSELSDLAFTELGERLYRKGQIEAEPASHGVTFTIDALTDEDLPEPSMLESWPPTRFLEELVGEPRDTLGLDRVRSAMRRFNTDILKGDAEVRGIHGVNDGASVRRPSLEWREVLVRAHLSPEGALTLDPVGLTRKAREFFASRDLGEDGVLPARPVSEDWGGPNLARTPTQADFAQVHRRVIEFIPAAQVAGRARQLVQEARTEVVMHACWGGAEELHAELEAAVSRGVHVLVVGAAETGLFAWVEPKGFGLQVEQDQELVGALLVDGARGLILEDVSVRLNGRPVVVEVAGALRDAVVAELRAELVRSAMKQISFTHDRLVTPPSVDLNALGNLETRITALLEDESLRMALARLALAPTASEVATVTRLAARLAPGLERTALLQRLVALARAQAPGLSMDALEKAWSAAWEAVATACRGSARVQVGLLEKLARWAPPAIPAEAYVDLAVDTWVRRAREPEEIPRRLLAISAAADARWRLGAARGCASWKVARDEFMLPQDLGVEALKQRAELAPRLLSTRESRDWASSCLRQLPRPTTLSGIDLWKTRASVVRELVGSDFSNIVVEVLRELVAGRINDAADIRRAVGDLLPPARLTTLVLGDSPTPEALAAVWRVFGLPEVEDPWAALVERTLPVWNGSFNAAEHADEVARCASALTFPVARKVLARWARRLANEIVRPTGLEGLPWWLGELAALAPALGPELPPLALAGLRPHAAALRDARKRDGPIWAGISDAWRSLAPGNGALEELAADPVPPQRAPDEKSKGKKGRRK